MKVDYKEIFKLKVMLDNANIPYEFIDKSLVMDDMLMNPFYQIIVYEPIFNQKEEIIELISVIQGYCTYGNKEDLLEIAGCLTEKEINRDSVLGFLTAKDVFKRIEKHYYEKLEENKCQKKNY